MSDKILKIAPQQGVFRVDGTTNLVDFILPADGSVYDLSKTHVDIQVKADATHATNVNARYNLNIQFNGLDASNNMLFQPSAMVKNCSLHSQNLGVIEDNRNRNIIQNTLSILENSETNLENTLGKAQYFQFDKFFPAAPNGDLESSGTENSRKVSHRLRIPLTHLYNIASASPLLDTGRMGQLRLRLEPKFNVMTAAEVETNALWQARRLRGDGGEQFIRSMATTTSNTSMNTVQTYESLEESSFWVGMPVRVNGALGANVGAAVAIATNNALTISSIVHNADNSLTLNFDGNIVAGGIPGGNSIFNGTVDYLDANAISGVVIEDVELVAHVVGDEQPPAKLNYTAFHNEEDNFPNGITKLNRYYMIEPACKNVFITFNAADNLVRSHDQLHSYRITIDGNEISPLDIAWDSSQHNDLVAKTLINRGRRPRSLNYKQHLSNDNLSVATAAGQNPPNYGANVVFISVPVPFVNKTQRLGIELNANDGGTLHGNINLFKEVAKQV